MDGLGPVAGRQLFWFPPALFQLLNKVEQRIHRTVLSRRAVLIHDRVDGDCGFNARQLMTGLVTSQRFDDGDRAMLTIVRISPPPNDAEELARTEVVDDLPAPLFVVLDRLSHTQTIEPSAGNIAGGESG